MSVGTWPAAGCFPLVPSIPQPGTYGERGCRGRTGGSGEVWRRTRKTVDGPYRTRGRGLARVVADRAGRQWVTCSGCGLDRFAPGVLPNGPLAREHAAHCNA